MLISASRSIRTVTGLAFTVVSSLHPVYRGGPPHAVRPGRGRAAAAVGQQGGLRDYLAEWATAVQATT